ncbi:2-hydroxyacid dehydrogenase [Fibrobacter sp.]|uniref:2-hydroxyacid dehydrogenase n=1 Tax=Fibrobacter sp. TaxID=35828 RepID=UPI00388E0E65
MPKILHTYRYTGKPWNILKSVVPEGYEIKTLDEPTQEQLVKEVVDADYFLVSGRLKIDEEVLSAAKKLKMIQRTGVGTEMLDKAAIKARGIPVYVNAGINARSVAEHTVTLVLDCLKNIPLISSNVKKGIWKKQETGVSCNELYGKTVAMVGMGNIGRITAGILHAFGANIVYTDLFRQSEETEKALGITYRASFEDLLPDADILTFHCPLTDDNQKILNAAALEKMKDGVIVVNTARGKLIDENALYKALVSGKVRAAGLDVHYEEPMLADDPLKTLDNVILTPHIAGLSFETFQSMMAGAIENIVAFDKDELESIKNKILEL